jgi:hypothetical protein
MYTEMENLGSSRSSQHSIQNMLLNYLEKNLEK